MTKRIQLALVRRADRWRGGLIVDGNIEDGYVSEDEKEFIPVLFGAFQSPTEGRRVTIAITIETEDKPVPQAAEPAKEASNG